MALAALPVMPGQAQTVVAPKPVTAGDIATKPLDDLNLKRDRVPDTLRLALEDPYRIPHPDTCLALAQEVTKLNAVLGQDIDTAPSLTLKQKRARAFGNAARAAVGSLIPFNGVVREITGANAAQRKRELYLYAGSLRRAFLKGYGTTHGCRYPARAATPHDKALAAQGAGKDTGK